MAKKTNKVFDIFAFFARSADQYSDHSEKLTIQKLFEQILMLCFTRLEGSSVTSV